MDDIKFRAWREKDKVFEYTTLFDFVKDGFRICESSKPYNYMPCTKQKAFVDDEYLDDFLKTCFYARADWEPFTGLTDKNGKEVYENDIVRMGSQIGVVEYDKFMFNIKGFYESYMDYPTLAFSEGWNFEVVGNIYENPELLEVK